MTTTTIRVAGRSEGTFVHEALLYGGHADFVVQASSFIRDAVAADEPILVVVSENKIDSLRAELDGDADEVRFADMAQVGRNPARIIPAWRDFVDEHAGNGRRFRGIGEPIWAERSPDELVECERHEALLNLAFARTPAWWLVCPYDTESLEPSVIEEARRNHPFLVERGARRESAMCRDLEAVAQPLDDPLPEPEGRPEEMSFEVGHLQAVRAFVARRASRSGLDRARRDDLVLAVNELATNSLRHAGGRGALRMWQDGEAVVCEVRDEGRIDQPLVGRERPTYHQEGGFGLWLVNQVCDLVQVRSFRTGSIVRVRMSRDGNRSPVGR